VTFFGGVVIIVSVRFTTDAVRKWRKAKTERMAHQSMDSRTKKKKSSCFYTIPTVYTKVQFYAEDCVSGKKLIGRILVIL
jgi:heme-degrading monooxygenase HmoA